jgi:hypothetical protein
VDAQQLREIKVRRVKFVKICQVQLLGNQESKIAAAAIFKLTKFCQ